MSHIDELQGEYPAVPREVIIKWEALSRGIRDSAVLDKVSTYDRGGFFASRDTDVTLKEIAKKRPEAIRSGFVLRAPTFVMRNGQHVRVVRDKSSPYEIREETPDRYALYEGEERVEEVYFPRPKHWQDEPEKEPLTSKGNPVTLFVYLARRCFQIAPVRHCEYFASGEQCKFCNYNATQEDASSVGAGRPITANPEETVEAYKIITSEMPPLIEGQIQMGGFSRSEPEARIHLDFVEKIASATSYVPHITLRTQPMARQTMRRLRDAGAAAISFNLEVWDPDIFAEVCPGKAKYRGRDRFLQAYQEAVDIFGWGHVGCNFVGGVTLMPEEGHRTWQEARDSHSEGNRWLIQHGVMPIFIPLRLGVGSTYGDDKLNKAKLAPTEYYLGLALAHHEACMAFDMYDRLDKLLNCPLDCNAGGYNGDIGIYATAGDLARWAATCVPADANWIAQFVDSVRSPAHS